MPMVAAVLVVLSLWAGGWIDLGHGLMVVPLGGGWRLTFD
jgi:hypothetical protein